MARAIRYYKFNIADWVVEYQWKYGNAYAVKFYRKLDIKADIRIQQEIKKYISNKYNIKIDMMIVDVGITESKTKKIIEDNPNQFGFRVDIILFKNLVDDNFNIEDFVIDVLLFIDEHQMLQIDTLERYL